MIQTGVQQGIWRLEQDSGTLVMRLLRYGHVIAEWTGAKEYSWEELYEMLLQESYERRGEK